MGRSSRPRIRSPSAGRWSSCWRMPAAPMRAASVRSRVSAPGAPGANTGGSMRAFRSGLGYSAVAVMAGAGVVARPMLALAAAFAAPLAARPRLALLAPAVVVPLLVVFPVHARAGGSRVALLWIGALALLAVGLLRARVGRRQVLLLGPGAVLGLATLRPVAADSD